MSLLLNKSSTLLSHEENNVIFSLLGPKCITLATTVVQRFIAGGNTNFDHWVFVENGILCFVKDSNQRSYFFRMFCPNEQALLWEHELYNHLEYIKLNRHLHAFEAEECMVAFNFANETEGDKLHSLVNGKLNIKREPRQNVILEPNIYEEIDVKRRRGFNNFNDLPLKKSVDMGLVSPPAINLNRLSFIGPEEKQKNKKPLIITKDMIGGPQNFVHLSHYGFDNKPNFNNLNDDKFQQFFKMAGVTESQLKKKKTSAFIYQFIEDHGGIDAVEKEITLAPEMNNELLQHNVLPPTPPFLPPTPPFLPPTPPLLPPITSLPPPPPPMINVTPPPHPPFAQADPRSALMDSIKSGTSLKHVTMATNDEIQSSQEYSNLSPRGGINFLEEIKQGVKLHSVPKNNGQNPKPRPPGGLAAALANALAHRASVIHSDSEGSSSSSENEEWE